MNTFCMDVDRKCYLLEAADSYEEVKKLREQAENSESKLADAYADLGRASTTWTATAVRMLEEQLATAQAEIAKLQAERDALAKDAERYRWLRNTAPNMFWDSADKQINFVKFDTSYKLWDAWMFDEAIDAAIDAVKQSEGG